MAGISTAIEIQDRVTGPMRSMMNVMNQVINTFAQLNSASNVDVTVDTTQMYQGLADVRSQIEALNQTPVQVPVTTQSAPQWQSPTTPEVFTNTGTDRLNSELQSANQMITQLVNNQRQVASQAAQTGVFKSNAISDMVQMQNRLVAIQQRIAAIEKNPLSFGPNAANELETLRNKMSQAATQQTELNNAVKNMDVSRANSAYNQLAGTIDSTEQYIRDNTTEQNSFNESVKNGQKQSNALADAVKKIAATYLSIQGVKKVIDVSDELASTNARINTMNQGFAAAKKESLGTAETMNMIYAAAQNARGSFGDMASVVARFGNNARDAFSSTEEVIQFANIVQKQMTIAGASTEEAANAELQLSQALGSGVLRGDELNSIFENAPNLIQSIADYMGEPIGKIREMAKEGDITSDIVKNAVLASADDVNAKFDQMPMTWNQAWTQMKNTALMSFQPVLTKITEMASSPAYQTFAKNAADAFATLASYALSAVQTIANIANFAAEHWNVLGPIILGVVGVIGAYNIAMGIANGITAIHNALEVVHAAQASMAAGATFTQTVAQYGLNAALAACPLTWIILLIAGLVAAIYIASAAAARATGMAETGLGNLAGTIVMLGAIVANIGIAISNVFMAVVYTIAALFQNLFALIGNIFAGIGQGAVAVANNMRTAFHNSIANVQTFFYNLLSTAMSVISHIANALNRLPFVNIDVSGLNAAASNYAGRAQEAQESRGSYENIGSAFTNGMSTFDYNGNIGKSWKRGMNTNGYFDLTNAYGVGQKWGDGAMGKLTGGFNKIKNSLTKTGNLASNFSKGDIASKIPNYSGLAKKAAGDDNDGSGKKTAANTKRSADALDLTNSQLAYLRNLRERQTINRFTTRDVKLIMNNSNNISSNMDLDYVINNMAQGLTDALDADMEGAPA